MEVFYINANCGDGSSRTEFYDSKECIDYLTDDERCDETYTDGDGGSWGVLLARWYSIHWYYN